MADTHSILSIDTFQKLNRQYDIDSTAWDFGWATATKNSGVLYDYWRVDAPGLITYRRWACFNSPEELLGALYHVWIPDMLYLHVMGEFERRLPLHEVLALTREHLDVVEFESLSRNISTLEDLALTGKISYEGIASVLERLQTDLTSVRESTTRMLLFTSVDSAMKQFFEVFDTERYDHETWTRINYESKLREALDTFDEHVDSRLFIGAFLRDFE